MFFPVVSRSAWRNVYYFWLSEGVQLINSLFFQTAVKTQLSVLPSIAQEVSNRALPIVE